MYFASVKEGQCSPLFNQNVAFRESVIGKTLYVILKPTAGSFVRDKSR